MKKTLSLLVLASFLAVLLAPATVSAIEPVCPNCAPPQVQCSCGNNTLPAVSVGGNLFCYYGNHASLSDLETLCPGGGTTPGGTNGGNGIITNIPYTSINTPDKLIDLIDTIGTWVFSALLAVVVIMLVLSGFYWLTAGGNAEQTKKARQMLTSALIGLAIALGARGLTAIITTLLA